MFRGLSALKLLGLTPHAGVHTRVLRYCADFEDAETLKYLPFSYFGKWRGFCARNSATTHNSTKHMPPINSQREVTQEHSCSCSQGFRCTALTLMWRWSSCRTLDQLSTPYMCAESSLGFYIIHWHLGDPSQAGCPLSIFPASNACSANGCPSGDRAAPPLSQHSIQIYPNGGRIEWRLHPGAGGRAGSREAGRRPFARGTVRPAVAQTQQLSRGRTAAAEEQQPRVQQPRLRSACTTKRNTLFK